MSALSRRAYILDVASEMAQVDGGYALCSDVLWDQPLKFDNEPHDHALQPGPGFLYPGLRGSRAWHPRPSLIPSPRPLGRGPHVGMSLSLSLTFSLLPSGQLLLLFLCRCWSGPLQPGYPGDTFSGRSDLLPPALQLSTSLSLAQ